MLPLTQWLVSATGSFLDDFDVASGFHNSLKAIAAICLEHSNVQLVVLVHPDGNGVVRSSWVTMPEDDDFLDSAPFSRSTNERSFHVLGALD